LRQRVSCAFNDSQQNGIRSVFFDIVEASLESSSGSAIVTAPNTPQKVKVEATTTSTVKTEAAKQD